MRSITTTSCGVLVFSSFSPICCSRAVKKSGAGSLAVPAWICRRYGFSQTGEAFRRCSSAVLRSSRQTGQLRGGGEFVGEHVEREFAHRSAVVSAGVWCQDSERGRQTGVPTEIEFQTKPEIALQPIRQAIDQTVPVGVVLADAGYGNGTPFRSALTQLGLQYAVGLESSTTVWEPGQSPLPAPSRPPGRPFWIISRGAVAGLPPARIAAFAPKKTPPAPLHH
jgi:hypothetical protein